MASVVLEIGRRWTKAGLSKESCPRLVEPTPPPLRRLIDEHGSRPSWDEYPGLVDGEEILTRHLRDLFLTKLFVSPPKCTVFVSLSMTSVHSHWETLLRHVLRERLFVPDVQFLSTQIASLLSVGVTSGVVVDIGWRDAIVVSVLHGSMDVKNAVVLPLGMKNLVRRTRYLDILKRATLSHTNSPPDKMFELPQDPSEIEYEKWENGVASSCIVRPFGAWEREIGCPWYHFLSEAEQNRVSKCAVEETSLDPAMTVQAFSSVKRILEDLEPISLEGSDHSLHPCSFHLKDRTVQMSPAARCLVGETFFESEVLEENLALSILDVIAHAPLRSRRLLMKSIVVCGGSSLIPGLEDRLLSEIYVRWEEDSIKWKNTLGSPVKPRILHGPFVSSLNAFVGASMMTILQTESVEEHEKAEERQARRRSRGSIHSFVS
eukprot:TRINITY_DN2309_c0_g3_i1.p1 TRINITY_DN2309_c0_g3~~TRINITY_DN2309_c0_g3_i1.p1  ORF type:complete len:471 (-),score=126.18 TRINITY_DN2309_c0_g3_i1:861-2159(-)